VPYTSTGVKIGDARVVIYQGAAFASYACFQPPISYVPGAVTEPGAGTITAGAHRVGYIIEDATGGILRPSPDNAGTAAPSVKTFTPVTFTAAGTKNASITLNPTTWPASAVKVHLIMTPVYNPNLYCFIPGANAAVTGGASDTKTIVWDITDEDLVAQGADATDHLFYLTQSPTGATAPFQPHCIFQYGDRMMYLVRDVADTLGNATAGVYASDPNAYQQVSNDYHFFQVPGQLDIVTGFAMRGMAFLLGPNYTYSTHDTGGRPVEWPAPALVDGRRGTLAPKGACVSPTGNYAWIANEGGLWMFDGSAYAALPVTYYNSDAWSRINWAVPACVEVLDDPGKRRVLVQAALDTATAPSHILTVDYTNGMTADTVSFSPWTVAAQSLRSMALVQNDLSGAITADAKHVELWLGTTSALLRQMSDSDTYPYRDVAAGIASTYETGPFPKSLASLPILVQHHGAHLRVTGAGSLVVTRRNLDNSWTQTLSPITLSTTPGLMYLRQMYRLGERATWRFATSAPDAHFTLSQITDYTSPYQMQR
jgi:hypothetical protein